MTRLRPHLQRCILTLALAALVGCTSLLPTSRTDVTSRWTSYDDAERALATLKTFEASREDVHQQGLDPRLGPGITVLHFADVMQRFTAVVQGRPERVDPGVNACLQSGQRCSAYAISVKKLARQRVGNFWADSLDFPARNRHHRLERGGAAGVRRRHPGLQAHGRSAHHPRGGGAAQAAGTAAGLGPAAGALTGSARVGFRCGPAGVAASA
ncbi:hypothetical protein [Hydrogenophaga sp.]|uniref:hypothetical protein n=1 Tax=Hydrogenophaga sp. TaxID=1904254 RepID=UPI00272F9A11|nr:hypothetical protein [Hydrogenophaga sp.]MDP1685428.1 hypothetical protein [Hydrogenophaga sp.]